MKFRSEFPITPFTPPLTYGDRILSLGSCFSEQIMGRLKRAKFRVEVNPLGVIFNPISIVRTLHRLSERRPILPKELHFDPRQGVWFHYDLHGSFAHPLKEEALTGMNRAIEEGAQTLEEANVVAITLGTAFAYRLRSSGEVVANCHKQEQRLFQKEMLSLEEILTPWRTLMEGPLRGKRVIFTLSPIRHLSDGAEENSLSKALLRVALGTLTRDYPESRYFPAWELMMDDLRDYRFYAEDLAHPSATAVNYLWERFLEAAVAPESRPLIERIEALQRSLEHRPLHPQSEASRTFLEKLKQEIDRLESLLGEGFACEKEILAQRFQ